MRSLHLVPDCQEETVESVTMCMSGTDRTLTVPPEYVRRPKLDNDTLLLVEIRRALAACGHPTLMNIDVQVVNGSVLIRGTVPTYYMKQLAQQAVMSVDGIQRIENDLQVA